MVPTGAGPTNPGGDGVQTLDRNRRTSAVGTLSVTGSRASLPTKFGRDQTSAVMTTSTVAAPGSTQSNGAVGDKNNQNSNQVGQSVPGEAVRHTPQVDASYSPRFREQRPTCRLGSGVALCDVRLSRQWSVFRNIAATFPSDRGLFDGATRLYDEGTHQQTPPEQSPPESCTSRLTEPTVRPDQRSGHIPVRNHDFRSRLLRCSHSTSSRHGVNRLITSIGSIHPNDQTSSEPESRRASTKGTAILPATRPRTHSPDPRKQTVTYAAQETTLRRQSP